MKKRIIAIFIGLLLIGVGCSNNSLFEHEDILYEQESEMITEEVNPEHEDIPYEQESETIVEEVNPELEIERGNIEIQRWGGERIVYGDFWSIRQMFVAQEYGIHQFMIQYPLIGMTRLIEDREFSEENMELFENINLIIRESTTKIPTGLDWEGVINSNPAINLVFLVWYRIELFTNDVFSITFHLYRSSPAWASSTSEEYAITIDLQTGEILSLSDVTTLEHVQNMFSQDEYRLIGADPTEGMVDFSLVFANALDEETTDRFYLTDSGEVCVIINSMTLPNATICIPLDYD